MQVVRLFLSFTVLSNGVGFISVTRSIAKIKAANAVNPPKKLCAKKRILIVCHRSNYYNCAVIGATVMQVVRLFSQFIVLSTGIDFISMTRSIAEIKDTNASPSQKKERNCAKKRILTVRHRSNEYNCVAVGAIVMQVARLFLSFTVFSNGIGFISVTRSIAEI